MGHLNLGKSILKQVQRHQGPGVTELTQPMTHFIIIAMINSKYQ